MTSIAQISENEQREIEGTLKKFFSEIFQRLQGERSPESMPR